MRMAKQAALFLSLFLLSSAQILSSTTPLVVALTGESAPGLDGGEVFTNMSPPAVTNDGQRVAFLAEVTGAKKVWYFGDKQQDGYFDLSVAAKSDMAVNGTDKVLDMTWFRDGSFIRENPKTRREIWLDPVTGKLAFKAYLKDSGSPDSGAGPIGLFIAENVGGTTSITLVIEEGLSDEFILLFEGESYPYTIAVPEVKFINDRLLMYVGGSNFDIGAALQMLILQEGNTRTELIKIENYHPEDANATIAIDVPDEDEDPDDGVAYMEFIRQFAMNERGTIVAKVGARVKGQGLWQVKDIELLRYKKAGEETMGNAVIDLQAIPAAGETQRVLAGIREFSLSKDDVVQAIATSYNLGGIGPQFGGDPGYVLITQLVDEPLNRSTQVFTDTKAVDYGYSGPVSGEGNITSITGLQTAGNYSTFLLNYQGDALSFWGNYGLIRYNHATDEMSDFLFYIGGPSQVSGVPGVTGIQHVLLSPNGHLIVQISGDQGFERALVHIPPAPSQQNFSKLSAPVGGISPKASEGTPTYNVLATTRSSISINCEFGCGNFLPWLPTLGFPPYLGQSGAPAAGAEIGTGVWNNGFEFSWLHSTDSNDLYVVIQEIEEREIIEEAIDYGDAPHEDLQLPFTPSVEIPFGYPEASQVITTGLFMGSQIDEGVARAFSQNELRYYGVDDDVSGADDEDGVTFKTAVKETLDTLGAGPGFVEVPVHFLGETIEMDVTTTVPFGVDAWVSIWIDWDLSGDFDEEDEFVADEIMLPGSNELTSFEIPFTPDLLPSSGAPTVGYTYARIRLTTEETAASAGKEGFGEVEDYLIKLIYGMDYGDAPQSGVGFNYQTLLTSNGARHTPLLNSPILGDEVDYEYDGNPSLDADGDDDQGTDDADGVVLPYGFPPSETVDVTVKASQDNAKLDAWIDFNRDGDWSDAGEQVFDSVDVNQGENLLQVNVPAEAEAGPSYARFRISADGNLNPFGLAQGGEVEDYKIEIGPAVIPWSSLRQEDGKLHLEWDGPAILQGTDDPDGPWATLVDDANSYSHTIDGAPQFFRLVHPAP